MIERLTRPTVLSSMPFSPRLLLSLLPALLCQCQTPYGPSPDQQPMAPLFGPSAGAASASRPTYPVPPPPQKPLPSAPQPPAPALGYPAYPTQATPPPPAPVAAWRVEKTSSPEVLHPGARYHEVRLASAQDRLRLDVILFDSRQLRLAVIDQPNPQAGGRIITEAMRFHRAVAGINGGFFSPEFVPIGLTIARGKALTPFAQSNLISGMALQMGDQPYLIWNSEYQGHAGVTDVLQSGPRLVDHSRPIPGLETAKPRARSFIATDGNFLWAIGTTDACTLGGLASALCTPGALPGLATMRALNLDGGNSTALWFRNASGKETARPGWSTVRNYLAILPK